METDSETFDTIIVGGGPAGFSAAIYASRASLSALVLEQGVPGGQIATSDSIENYPGILEIGGAEIGQRMQEHAEQSGAKVDYGMVTELERNDDGSFTVTTDMGSYTGLSVIVCAGAAPRTAGFEGEGTFRGRGVSYCATCDAMFYRGKDVFVVGGGNSACEEAIYLANVVDSVTMVVRRDRFRAPKGMVDKILANPKITVRYLTSIVKVSGEKLISEVTFKDNSTGDTHTEHHDEGSIGIFVFAGTLPQTTLVSGYVDLGPDGGVLTDDSMATKTPGLFCAGDIRTKQLRQVITAASDGAIAGNAAYHYVEDHFRT